MKPHIRNVLITNTSGNSPRASFFSGILNGGTRLTAASNDNESIPVADICPVFKLDQKGFVVDCDIPDCPLRKSLGKIASCVCVDGATFEDFKHSTP